MQKKAFFNNNKLLKVFAIVVVVVQFLFMLGVVIYQSHNPENKIATAVPESEDIGAYITFDSTVAQVNFQRRQYNGWHKKWVIENHRDDTITVKWFQEYSGMGSKQTLSGIWTVPPHEIIAHIVSNHATDQFSICQGLRDIGFVNMQTTLNIRKVGS